MDPSDKHHWQPAAGQLGPPSSPAVTRCVGANAQGHGRNYSQPVPLADIRPLRVRKFGASMSAAGDRNASWQDGAVQQGMVSRRPVHQTQCGSAPLTWPSNAGERNHAWRDVYPAGIPDPGDSVHIWNRVVSAASAVAGGLDMKWAASDDDESDVQDGVGEEESHLTRVLKAYYLKKAQDPSDLPDWLFTEAERAPVVRSRFLNRNTPDAAIRHSENPVHSGSQEQGYRHMVSHARVPAWLTARGSTATDRLRVLREAKRADMGLRPPSHSHTISNNRRPGAF